MLTGPIEKIKWAMRSENSHYINLFHLVEKKTDEGSNHTYSDTSQLKHF